MGTIAESFVKTFELLVALAAAGAEGAYQKAKPQARLYLKSLLVTALVGLALIPALALAKMVTGTVVFAYAAALLAIVFTLILGLLWSPLGVVMSMLTENTLNPVTGGERFVRFIATVLFAELMVSSYLIRVPTHQNLEAVPLLILATAAVGLGIFVWGGFFSGKFYVFVAMAMAILTTLSFFLPQTFAVMGAKATGVDKELAQAITEPAASYAYRYAGRTSSILEFPIEPVNWSDWKILTYRSTCHTPGWQEFWFSTGEKIRVNEDGSMFQTLSDGTIRPLAQFPDPMPSNTFRLRGRAGLARFNPS